MLFSFRPRCFAEANRSEDFSITGCHFFYRGGQEGFEAVVGCFGGPAVADRLEGFVDAVVVSWSDDGPGVDAEDMGDFGVADGVPALVDGSHVAATGTAQDAGCEVEWGRY